ncbi:aminotransferase class I/II-fold pyridoxal phosphate-dependent enzyme [Syntrophobotulus glycolicus]|uniref:methionine gamma-lyase family protein n=1 Tax=Syntrophobotulus glycolicus TaxID=51197 RepID=UPI00059C2B48|nr:methionine gamma-lyase family protein [Syntrophobotulus glycolicus]
MNLNHLPSKIELALHQAQNYLSNHTKGLDLVSQNNHQKVLAAFQKSGISTYHLSGTTGYGLGDSGRENLDNIVADIMGTEKAMIRHQFVSGTHAISSALFGLLRPGDHFLSVTGMPYDTLQKVIGLKETNIGSLKEFGIDFDHIPLDKNSEIQLDLLAGAVKPNTKLFILQRSRGYEWRNAVTIAQIEAFTGYAREKYPYIKIFVDNCYGELVEEREPGDVGADLMAGSLIKNLGGTLAPAGGYIAGREELVELAANRFAAPGLGTGIGATLDHLRLLYQGLFLSPLTVREALKSAVFSSVFWQSLGFDVHPEPAAVRSDTIQAVRLGSKEKMIAFCQGLQKGSPIDSHVLPLPAPMPGYSDEVIMAGGTFIQGATSEFSADGPIREPYVAYMQGGISFDYVKLANILAALNLSEKGFLA